MPDEAKLLIPSAAESSAGHRSRLRERFQKNGLEAFAEYEVVELLLTLAIPRSDVKPQAKALIAKFGSLKGVLEAPIEDLMEIPGLGTVAPVALRIIKAAAELYLKESAESETVLNNYQRLEAFWRARLGELKHEVMEVAYLDKGYKLLKNGVERLAEGSIDGASLSLQSLLKKALQRGARFIVLAHNHPSGDLTPSSEDRALTERVAGAARAVEIELLDHWIVTQQGCYSFRKTGVLLSA
jgi:DNA repair protein RadC